MRVCLIEDKPGLGVAGQSLSVEDATGAAWIADGTARVADNCGDPKAWDLQAQRDKSAAQPIIAPPHSKDNPPPPATRAGLHK